MALLSQFDGDVDPRRLAAAFERVVASADVLRTVFDETAPASDSTLRVAATVPAATEFVSIPQAELSSWIENRAQRPIDLRVAAYDSVILLHEDSTCSWYLAFHHFVTDATGSSAALDATAAAYHDEAIDLGSYYSWVARRRVSDSQAASSWDRPAAPRLSSPYGLGSSAGTSSRRTDVDLDSVTALLDERLASDYRGLTRPLALSTLVTAATALYLHRLTGSTQFSIGLPVHNRNRETQGLVGPTIAILPVDVIVDPEDTHRTLHARIAKSVATTLGHAQDVELPAPDYDAVVNVIPAHPERTLGGSRWLTQRLAPVAIDPDQFLRVQASPDSATGRLSLALDIGERMGTAADTTVVAGHFRSVLERFLADPDAPIGDASICSDDELTELASWGVECALDGPATSIVQQLESVLAHNDSIVLRDQAESLTGRALWDWVRGIADDLHSRYPQGARVGVELGPSLQAVALIFGTLASGGSFVPLDPTTPESRRNRMAERAGLAVRFADRAAVDAFRTPRPDSSFVVPSAALQSDAEAYLLFTSGSTGEPKAVPITRGGLNDYLAFALASYFESDNPPVAPLFGSLGFDLTLTSLFGPILAGGTLVAVHEHGPAALAEIARIPDITWCKATPSHLEILVGLLPTEHQLATLVVGGEAFRTSLAQRLLAWNPAVVMFNEYGPTEAVVGCMIHRVVAKDLDGADIPIGRPAPGVTLRIVDGYGQQVPPGIAGELWVSHPGVTTGYLGETADDTGSFAIADGQRFYTTRDVVRFRNGELTYVGRQDEQMKVGGIRLDPAEIERTIDAHPEVRRSLVRQWSPRPRVVKHRCIRCGLPDNVPETHFDTAGVCGTCQIYEEIEPVVQSWFKTPSDLIAKRDATRRYDCLHLLSGGKDSTYALYRLVDFGFRPYVMTLDNGFLSESALSNARQTCEHLGLEHEIATTVEMNDVFRDSLANHSNVCNGCFKTIYTLAANRADELKIPLIVTGLSRGQLFETRLTPGQFRSDQFDPESIDAAVVQARKHYHRVDDLTNRVLPTNVFTDSYFEQVEYVDFYRYVDVELADMLRYLDERTKWSRPPDTGRSTNCLINVAGIHTHLIEQGYHNYAVPYAWDVRLGHKTRDEAIAELEDDLDLTEVQELLARVGYRPRIPSVLTAWVEPTDDAPSVTDLRDHVAAVLPSYAVPTAFVIGELPMTANGKVDDEALPAPLRRHRSPGEMAMRPTTDLESTITALYEQRLGIEPIGIADDFFGLGGDSLAALEMITALGRQLGRQVKEELAFTHTTPEALAAAVEMLEDSPLASAPGESLATFAATEPAGPPALSDGEKSILFEQRARPDSTMYNPVGIYVVEGSVEPVRFEQALRDVARCHEPLRWSYSSPRRELASAEAVSFASTTTPIPSTDVNDAFRSLRDEPYDLENGPLVRCQMKPLSDGRMAIGIGMHHVSCDDESFDVLWHQIDAYLRTDQLPAVSVGYGQFCAWQRQQDSTHRDFWHEHLEDRDPNPVECDLPAEPDGVITRMTEFTAADLSSYSKASSGGLALAAAAAAVRPYVGGDASTIGLIATTRTDPVADDLVGYLLNPLPLQVDCSMQATLEDLAVQATTAIGRTVAHRSYPFAAIVADCRQLRRPVPTLDLLVVASETGSLALEGIPVERLIGPLSDSVAGLTFFLHAKPHGVILSLEYSGEVVSSEIAELLLVRFEAALKALLDSSQHIVAELPLPVEAQSVLVGPEIGDVSGVLETILRHPTTRPDEAAVVCGDETLSWSELGDRSLQVATSVRSAGFAVGDRVLLCMSPSVDLIAALLGILRAGATYVPVDPEFPAARVAMLVEESGAVAALVDADNDHRVPASLPRLSAQTPVEVEAESSWPEVSGAVGDNDTAYIIFTSGSTGTPSGVAISHAQLSRSTAARTQVYDADPTRFVLLSSISFDSSIVGLFWTLSTGGTVVLPTAKQRHDVDAVVDLLASPGVSHTLCVPTLYRALLDRRPAESPHWPTNVIVAGEAVPQPLVTQHFAAVDSTLTNEYGPTEASVWASAHRFAGSHDPVSIGSPIPGTWIAIASDGVIRPQGVRGELLIGGPNIAAGYINDRPSTAERFVTDVPLASHLAAPYFRTGDIASIADGRISFHGRADDRLTIAGMRIEPREIEQVLESHEQVVAAVATVVDTRDLAELLHSLPSQVVDDAIAESATADGSASEALLKKLREEGSPELRLVAHVEAGAELDVTELRAVAADLPANQRPSRYVIHDRLPRTPTGKVDRRAASELRLPPAIVPTPSPARDADTVTHFVRHFSAVLHQTIAHNESFFDAGGDSLLGVELLGRIEDSMGIFLPTTALYESPTPSGLAELVADLGLVAQAPEAPSDERVRSLIFPLQTEGSKAPIVALQSIGPEGSYYRPLADALGPDQPFYAMADPHKRHRSGTQRSMDLLPPSVTEMAATYVRAIEQVVPSGPVTVVGACNAAIVAFEVSQQLTQRGRGVNRLVMIDAAEFAPDGSNDPVRSRSERVLRSLREVYEAGPAASSVFFRKARTAVAIAQFHAEDQAVKLAKIGDRPLSRRLLVHEYVKHVSTAISDYVCRSYDGPVSIIRFDQRAGRDLSKQTGWESVLADVAAWGVPCRNQAQSVTVGYVDQMIEVFREAVYSDRAPAKPLSRSAVEQRLVDGIYRGGFTREMEIALANPNMSPAASSLVGEVETAVMAISAAIDATADHVRAVLQDGGHDCTLGERSAMPTQNRLVVFVESPLADIAPLLVAQGYNPVAGSGGDRIFVRAGDSTRVRLIRSARAGISEVPPVDQFLRTPSSLVAPLLRLADCGDQDLLVDVGCGDAAVLIEAVRHFGCSGRGIEADQAMAETARQAVADAGLADRIEIIGDLVRPEHVIDATVAFVFLPEAISQEVVAMLGRTADCRIVAHEQVPVTWSEPCDETVLVVSDEHAGNAALTVAHVWHRQGH